METILRSVSKAVHISIEKPLVIIGEKINPTGRKKMMQALQTGNFEYVREMAQTQSKPGRMCWM